MTTIKILLIVIFIWLACGWVAMNIFMKAYRNTKNDDWKIKDFSDVAIIVGLGLIALVYTCFMYLNIAELRGPLKRYIDRKQGEGNLD